MEEDGEEMVIGAPTDVKHVTHIGLDDSETTTNPNPTKGWHSLIVNDGLPSESIRDFQLAIAEQIQAPLPTVPLS